MNKSFPLYASVSLAFALMGDAFLYSFLPTNADSVNVPLLWVGTILSINRFARIILNPLILRIFNRFGFKLPTIFAVALAVVTTALYGFGVNIAVWVFLRVLWGVSYSILRVSALTYALDSPRKGYSLGLSQSIIECGPLFSLLISPFLLGLTGPATTFLIIGGLSITGIYFAMKLPERERLHHKAPVFKMELPSTFNGMAFISAFSVEGLLLVLIGSLLLNNQPSLNHIGIVALTAGFLSFRRVCSVLISPVTGRLADHFGLINVFLISILGLCLGFMMIATGLIYAGLITVFTFYNVNSSLAAGGASAGKENITHAVSQNATYRDAGAAFGALAGGFMLAIPYLQQVFMLCGLVLMALVWVLYREQKA